MHDPYVTDIDVPRPADLGGGAWKLVNLTSITVLFGKNGSGKSRLLRLWRDKDPNSIHYVVPERTGTLEFEAGYLRQELSGQERSGLGQRNYLSEYRQHVVTRVQAYFAARGNVRSGELPGNPAELEFLLSQLIPDFAINLDGLRSPPYQLTRAADQTPVSGIDQLSSGEAQLLTIGLDVLTIAAIWEIEKRGQRIVLIDEPDAHIHPDLQVRFADFLIAVASRFDLQVGIATHSTTFMAALGQFGGEAASVVYLDRTKSDFVAQKFTSINRELSACLGGHALMGPLFGVPLLLVEGDDDYRIWSQVPRYHVVSFAAIPSGGDEIKAYQKALEKIFTALKEDSTTPAGYALIDADKGKPVDQHTPQHHIRYIQLACHESENLYLTDNVLAALGTTWEQAKASVLAAASQYGKKAAKLSTIENWDRKTQDIKDVIEQLAAILDPKSVHWTLRVARTTGTTRPQGQLLDFLGAEVVNALWGPPPASPVP